MKTISNIKRYFIYLYYRLGARAGTVFYIALGIGIVMILLLILGSRISPQLQRLEESRGSYNLRLSLQEKSEEVVEETNTCDAQVNEVIQLFTQANSESESEEETAEGSQRQRRRFTIPQFNNQPSDEGIALSSDAMKLVTLAVTPDVLAYTDENGKSPTLTSLIGQYRIRAKNFERADDRVWQALTLLKIANSYLILGRAVEAKQTLDQVGLMLDDGERKCFIQTELEEEIKNAVLSGDTPEVKTRLLLQSSRRSCNLVASYHQSMGLYYSMVSDPTKSLEQFDLAIGFYDTISRKDTGAYLVRAQRANVLAQVGRINEATNNINFAISAFQKSQTSSFLPLVFVGSINQEIQTGSISNAQNRWEEASKAMTINTDNISRALLLYGFAEYLRLGGKPQEALERYRQANDFFYQHQFLIGVAYTSVGMAQAALATGRSPTLPNKQLKIASDIFKRAKHKYGSAIVALVRSDQANRAKDRDGYARHLKEAQTLIGQDAYPPLNKEIDSRLAKL